MPNYIANTRNVTDVSRKSGIVVTLKCKKSDHVIHRPNGLSASSGSGTPRWTPESPTAAAPPALRSLQQSQHTAIFKRNVSFFGRMFCKKPSQKEVAALIDQCTGAIADDIFQVGWVFLIKRSS